MMDGGDEKTAVAINPVLWVFFAITAKDKKWIKEKSKEKIWNSLDGTLRLVRVII